MKKYTRNDFIWNQYRNKMVSSEVFDLFLIWSTLFQLETSFKKQRMTQQWHFKRFRVYTDEVWYEMDWNLATADTINKNLSVIFMN